MSLYELRHKKTVFAYAKTKTQISLAVAFVFATRIVQFLYFLNLKFQASSHLLWLYSPVCVGPGRKPRRQVFSQRSSYNLFQATTVSEEQTKKTFHTLMFYLALKHKHAAYSIGCLNTKSLMKKCFTCIYM